MGTDGKGLARAILEVMIDGFQRLVYEEDEAVTAKAVFEELENGNFDEYFEQGQTEREELDLSKVRSALKRMERPTANRPSVVLSTGHRAGSSTTSTQKASTACLAVTVPTGRTISPPPPSQRPRWRS